MKLSPEKQARIEHVLRIYGMATEESERTGNAHDAQCQLYKLSFSDLGEPLKELFKLIKESQ